MTKEKKFKIWLGVIWGLGTLLLIGIGAAWAMLLMKPENENLAKINDELAALKTTAQGLAAARQALAEAEAREVNVNKQLAFFRNRYRSLDYRNWKPGDATPTNLAYQEAIWREQMREFSYDYGPRLMGELLGAAQSSGVTLTGWNDLKIAVQDPPKGPEDLSIPPNGFYRPTGGALPVEIVGNLDQIQAFFKKIHQGQILMTVGSSLKLSGSSPRITATFSVQPYLVAKGDNVVLSAVAAPAAGAAGAAAAPASGAPAGSGSPPTSTGTPGP
ncbi:MAG TPA: hypothetical protein VGB77_10195 [Abditibacteriaceae bacterium]|jgi:hypothetical protein